MVKRKYRKEKKVNPKKVAFLAAYAKCGMVTKAASIANVALNDHYRWKDEDPEYVRDFAEAHKKACEVLEAEAIRRAMDGVDEPIVYQGQITKDDAGQPVTVKKYSDTLLIFTLKGAMPEKYKERTEHSGNMNINHSIVDLIQGGDKAAQDAKAEAGE